MKDEGGAVLQRAEQEPILADIKRGQGRAGRGVGVSHSGEVGAECFMLEYLDQVRHEVSDTATV